MNPLGLNYRTPSSSRSLQNRFLWRNEGRACRRPENNRGPYGAARFLQFPLRERFLRTLHVRNIGALEDRQRDVWGKRVSLRDNRGGLRIINNIHTRRSTTITQDKDILK